MNAMGFQCVLPCTSCGDGVDRLVNMPLGCQICNIPGAVIGICVKECHVRKSWLGMKGLYCRPDKVCSSDYRGLPPLIVVGCGVLMKWHY